MVACQQDVESHQHFLRSIPVISQVDPRKTAPDVHDCYRRLDGSLCKFSNNPDLLEIQNPQEVEAQGIGLGLVDGRLEVLGKVED